MEEVGISLKSHGLEGPNYCSAVLIAGKYLDHMDEVMLFMNNVTRQAQSIPFAVFLFGLPNDEPITFNNSLRSLMRV